MIDGFQDAVNELIEKRLEKIINSEEFIMYSETIYRDLEEKLAQFNQSDDEEVKKELVEGLRQNIFEQVFLQSKIAYRLAFSDAIFFAINTFMLPHKF